MRNFSIIFISLIAILMASCSDSKPATQLENWGTNLLTQHPNYRSNEIAKNAFNDSITAYCESFVGQDASLFDGVEFTFKELVKNDQTDAYSAIFVGKADAEIESNADGGKYLSCTFFINAMGIVSEDVAASLSSGYKYSISGKVHAWDGDDLLNIKPGSCSVNDAYMGMFIIDNLRITKIDD